MEEKKDEQEKVEKVDTETTENTQEAQAENKEQVTKQEEVKEEKKEEKTQENAQKFEKVTEKAKKEKPESSSKKKKGPIVAVVAIIAIVAAVVAFFLLRTTTIKLADCFTIEYEGYSGFATAKVEINEKAIKEKIKDSSVARSFIKKLEEDLEVENTTGLSNGDEITIKVKVASSFLDENKIKLDSKTVKIKVEGVKEPTAIDMSKYIEIKYTGFNGHATAEATLKTDELSEELGSELYSILRNRITLTVQENGTLSNGENAKVKIETNNTSYLEENGIKFASDTVEFKVEGLSEATEVDAFANITLNISGMSPNLSVTITNNSTDEFLKTVEYSLSKRTGIANGEKITVTATEWDEEMAQEKKLALKETTKEYTISGQAAYIFSTSEFTDAVKAEVKSIMTSKATSKANENYERWSDNVKNYVRDNTDYKYIEIDSDEINRDLTAGTPEIASLYLLTKKDDKNVSKINIITAIVKIPMKSAKAGVTYDWYVTIEASNASLTTEGKISENTEYSITAREGEDEEKAYQEYINDKKDNYNVEKISL